MAIHQCHENSVIQAMSALCIPCRQHLKLEMPMSQGIHLHQIGAMQLPAQGM